MKKRVLLYIPALLFFSPLLLPEKKLTILPYKGESGYWIRSYTDDRDTTKGSMGTFSDTTDSIIVFSFTLDTVNHSDAITPISGFNMIFDKYLQGTSLDVSKYGFLDIGISIKGASSFLVYLKYHEFFTDTAIWWTRRYTEAEVSAAPSYKICHLEFKKFKIPDFWKRIIPPDWFFNMPEDPDYTRLREIDFQSSPGPLHVPQSMEIKRIEFREDRRPLLLIVTGCFLFWIFAVSVAFLIFFIIKRRRPDLTEEEKTQLSELESFMQTNFKNPDLNQKMAAAKTHIPEHIIKDSLRKVGRGGFIQYLNFIRIENAKHKLVETDNGIAQIAYEVGYKHIPTFNRVFRQLTRMSPKDYRKLKRGKKEK